MLQFRGMVLSDRTIKEKIAKGRILIEPLDPARIQPGSFDAPLDNKFLVSKTWRCPYYIDVRRNVDDLSEPVEIGEDRAFLLNAREFALASILESTILPDNIAARLEGKSSLGRISLLIHSTASYVNLGWLGHFTLELSNVAKLPITLYYKMAIGRLPFLRLTSPLERLYGSLELQSKYQGQTEPAATRYYKEFTKEN